jgi:hypothetical protein
MHVGRCVGGWQRDKTVGISLHDGFSYNTKKPNERAAFDDIEVPYSGDIAVRVIAEWSNLINNFLTERKAVMRRTDFLDISNLEGILMVNPSFDPNHEDVMKYLTTFIRTHQTILFDDRQTLEDCRDTVQYLIGAKSGLKGIVPTEEDNLPFGMDLDIAVQHLIRIFPSAQYLISGVLAEENGELNCSSMDIISRLRKHGKTAGLYLPSCTILAPEIDGVILLKDLPSEIHDVYERLARPYMV